MNSFCHLELMGIMVAYQSLDHGAGFSVDAYWEEIFSTTISECFYSALRTDPSGVMDCNCCSAWPSCDRCQGPTLSRRLTLLRFGTIVVIAAGISPLDTVTLSWSVAWNNWWHGKVKSWEKVVCEWTIIISSEEKGKTACATGTGAPDAAHVLPSMDRECCW